MGPTFVSNQGYSPGAEILQDICFDWVLRKRCAPLKKSENGAKTYFRNCSNYSKSLDSEIIGGLYFAVSLRNKYCFLTCYNTN